MAQHTHYHSDNATAADSGTIALVVLLLGVLIIGLIAYRTLWAGRDTTSTRQNDTTINVPSVTSPAITTP